MAFRQIIDGVAVDKGAILADDLTQAVSPKANINSPTFTGTVSGITKSMVGLGNIDNTSDVNKPISSATQVALNSKAELTGGFVTPSLIGSRIDTEEISSFLATSTYETSFIASSLDGISWSESATPFAFWPESLSFGQGKIFAIELSFFAGRKAYSTNGITWTTVSAPGNQLRQSVFGNGVFITYDTQFSSMYYSTDAITWSFGSLPSLPNPFAGWGTAAFGAGRFVVLSSGGSVATHSTNGITWANNVSISDNYWTSVIYGGDRFVAVGRSNSFSDTATSAYSTDGITWQSATLPSTTSWPSVTYGDGKFVAVGGPYPGSQRVAYSTDGISWTQVSIGTSSDYFQDIAYTNGRFVTVSRDNNVALSSTDAITWTTNSTPRTYLGIASFNNTVSSEQAVASRKYVDDSVASLVDSSPAALNTLNELAAALNDDANFATTVTTALGNKQDKVSGVSDAEIGYLDGVTSAIQAQINGKANTSHTHAIADVTNLQTGLDAKANLAGPTFTGTVSGITKAMVGLANVDNTTDAGKPVSTATQTALDLKANIASPTFTGTVSGNASAASAAGDGAKALGFKGIPASSAGASGAYTLVAADAGELVYTTSTRTVTIPSNASVPFEIGTSIVFVSGAGATTTIAITSDTMLLAGPGTTGSRTLAAHGMATAVKVAATTWYISGNGLT